MRAYHVNVNLLERSKFLKDLNQRKSAQTWAGSCLEVEGKFEIQSILPVLPVPGEIVRTALLSNRLFTTIVNSN